MNITKLKNKFLNKICTIVTVFNKSQTDTQFLDFFTCKVEDIDENGVWGSHCLTQCCNFYFFSSIVAILEEQVIDENNKDYKKIVEEIKKSPQPEKKSNIDLDSIIKISNDAKSMLRKN